MTESYLAAFGDPACLDAAEFGGKAAGLAGLAASGMPVAPGFAIGAAAYREFLRQPGAPVPGPVAGAIREGYLRLCQQAGAADVAVAVRSSATAEDSATASFAGGFETWLGVTGAEDVVAHVRRCWNSVAAPRAVSYAVANGLDPAGVQMAVVVQRTVPAGAAGVMFTISPVTGDRSRIVVEASWGLGLAVVSGEVTPDRWVVDKVSLQVVDKIPGDKRVEYLPGGAAAGVAKAGVVKAGVAQARWATPCLTDEQVIELARMGKRVEREKNFPQDIEFALDDATGELVLLQCRPETIWSGRARAPKFTAGHGVTRWITAAITEKAA
jgi:pyruvate,water dikinase